MIPVREARALVARHAAPLGEETLPLADALGRMLAVTVAADRDDPAFDKSLMDGYAVRAADLPGSLRVTGRVEAGQDDLPEVGPGEAAWINTGAPLPPGADAVAPVEWAAGSDPVSIARAVEPGAHVLPRGHLVRAGDALYSGRLSPEAVAVCAAAGADPVAVRRRPRVGVLATGSELAQDPGPHGIRNSNGPLLRAMLASCADVDDLGVVEDRREALRATIEDAKDRDVLVTSGGVSKGDRDYVRPMLEELGYEIVLHGVALQPGKPFLFARKGDRFAFGLPGNPASATVCAQLFVVPFCRACEGEPFEDHPRVVDAVLASPVTASPQRERVFPCRLEDGRVDPLPWRSSADLYTLARANAYVVIEAGADRVAGDLVRCLVPAR